MSKTIQSFCLEQKLTKSEIHNLREGIALGIGNTSVLKITSLENHLWTQGEDEPNLLMYKAYKLLGELSKFAPVQIQSSKNNEA